MRSLILIVVLLSTLLLFACSPTRPGEMPASVLRKIQTKSAERFFDRKQRRIAIQKQIIAYHKINNDKDPRIPPGVMKEMKTMAASKNPDNYVYQLFTLQAQKSYFLKQKKEALKKKTEPEKIVPP